jgi:hypothetical protein
VPEPLSAEEGRVDCGWNDAPLPDPAVTVWAKNDCCDCDCECEWGDALG